MHEELMIWFAQAVAHSLWEGVAIGVVAWLLLRCLRTSPTRQHVVLSGALLLMALCLPVNLAFLAPEIGGGGSEKSLEPAAVVVKEALATEVVIDGMRFSAESARRSPAPSVASTENPSGWTSLLAGVDWSRTAPWVVSLYGLGLVVMLTRLGLACGGSRYLRKGAKPVREVEWTDRFERVRRRLGVTAKPLLGWSSEVAAPVLVGVFKPAVLLPVALANRLTIEQAEAILAHELAHLRRHDQWMLAVQRMVETVLFFHPVIWWMSRELNRTREQACDDLVLASGSQPADYAETLVLCSELRIADADVAGNSAMQLAATGRNGSSLRERVMRVLGQDEPIQPGRTGWVLVGLFVLAFAIAGVGVFPRAEAAKPGQHKDKDPAANQNPLQADPALDPAAKAAEPDLANPLVVKANPRAVQYTVRKGDSLWSIVRTYRMTVAEFRELNPDVKGDILRVGQDVMVVPKHQQAPGPAPGTAILAELLLAEVRDEFVVNKESMTREALAKNKATKIVSAPKLIVQSGRKGTLEVSSPAEGYNPNNPQVIGYAVEVSPVLEDGHVTFTMRVTRSQGAVEGTKRLVRADVEGRELLGASKPFVVGSMIGGNKLVGTVRFRKAVAGERADDPKVFQLRPNGRVRWRGKEFALHDLKAALPEKGTDAVIRAERETPYHRVMELLEILKPVFMRVAFAVEPGEWPGAADAPAPGGFEARALELLQKELRDLEIQLQAQTTLVGPEHAHVLRTKEQIEAVRKALAELEADEARRRTEESLFGAELLEVEEKRRNLMSGGFGPKHPQVRALEARRQELLKRAEDDKMPQLRRARARVAEAELRDLEDEVEELLERGLGEKHPQLLIVREKIATLRKLLEATKSGPNPF